MGFLKFLLSFFVVVVVNGRIVIHSLYTSTPWCSRREHLLSKYNFGEIIRNFSDNQILKTSSSLFLYCLCPRMQQLSEMPKEYGSFWEKYDITFLNFQNSTHEFFIPICVNLNFYFTMPLWSITRNQRPALKT